MFLTTPPNLPSTPSVAPPATVRRGVASRGRLACTLFLVLAACSASSTTTADGGRSDAAIADSGTADAGSCAPGDIADWSCVQGDPETHLCTDSMYPPTCTDGRWQCSGAGQPDWLVDCWCHVGPWPWPEYASLCACTEADGWTCDFPCGPALRCAASTEYCARTPSDVGGEPDSYTCRAYESCSAATRGCECVAPGSVDCESVENGGIRATYPGA